MESKEAVEAMSALEGVQSALIETVQYLKMLGGDKPMMFTNEEPQDLCPRFQNLNRSSAIRDLPTIIDQPDSINNVIENIRITPIVAKLETNDRLQKGAEELENTFTAILDSNDEFEKLLDFMENTTKEVMEVKEGIEESSQHFDTEDEELAQLTLIFDQCKKDLSFILETFCPENKEEIKSFLSFLEKENNRDNKAWHMIPDEISLSTIMLLKRCFIVEQHPELSDHFRLSPLFDQNC